MFGLHTRSKKQKNSTKKFVPHKYQLKSIKFLVSRASAGLFLTPGLGKTICTLSAFNILKKKKLVKRMLIVAKLRICYNVWPKEIKKWDMPFTYKVLHRIKKEEYLTSTADIDIINYEGLSNFCNRKRIKTKKGYKTVYTPKPELKDKYDLIVFDESSKLRNTNTIRFSLVKKLIQFFDRRYILTGSPAPNGLINLFGQMYVLDNGKTFSPYITKFRSTYFYPSGYMGYLWKILPGMEEVIYKKIKPYVIRFGDDEIDLPPLNSVINRVTLNEDSYKVYKELEKEFITEVKEETVTAANAAVASGKLRQVASGGVYTGRGKNRKAIHIHDEKTEECIEIVEELQGSPCIIAYEWHHDLERLREAFPEASFLGDDDSSAIEDKWNAGEIEVLLANPASVAHGLNLQESGFTLIFYTTPYDLENYEQMIRRLWRQGQKNKVVVHHIIADGTIDEDVLTSLSNKDYTQQSFLKAMEDRLGVKFKQEKRGNHKLNSKEIILRAFPNPNSYVYSVPEEKDFITGLFQIIPGWMPVKHREFLKNCGVTVKKEEELSSLLNKTKKAIKDLFGMDSSGEIREKDLINDLINYYCEVNNVSKKTGFGSGTVKAKTNSKKKANTKKKVAAKKKATTKKKVVASRTETVNKMLGGAKKKAVHPSKDKKNNEMDGKLLKLLKRKKGCSVKEAASSLKQTESTIRSTIDRLRKSGETVKSLGKGVFHAL